MSNATQRIRSRLLPLVGAAACLILAGGGLTVPRAQGATTDASIILKPSVGPPTTKIAVSGQGFGSMEHVLVSFGSKLVGSATTDEGGGFSVKIKVPSSARPGERTVIATVARPKFSYVVERG